MSPPPIRPNDLRQRLPAGTMLDGVYAIEGEIGAGGFGITYLGRDTMLGHKVAIKEYFPSDIGNRDSTLSVQPASQAFGQVFRWGRESFVREAQMLASFRHPNIVRVLRYFEANNTAYMALEHEEGRSLSQWLAEVQRGPGGHLMVRQPTQAELDRVTAGLCDALTLIHEKRLIHRDIAPDNIIIRADGSPVLLDFGAARYEVADQTRRSGHSVHTTSFAIIKAHYSPFEQRSTDTTRRGPWSDVYALGATLYRAVTGGTPIDAADRMAGDHDPLAPAVDAATGSYRRSFLEAIDKALALKPGDRPQSVRAFRELAFAGVRAQAVQGVGQAAGKTPDDGVPHSVVSFSSLPGHRVAGTGESPVEPRPRRAMVLAGGLLLLGLGAIAAWTGVFSRDRAATVASASQSGPATPGKPAEAKAPAGMQAPEADRSGANAEAQTRVAEARQRRDAEAAQRAEQQAAADRLAAAERLASEQRREAEVRLKREEADRIAAEAGRQAAETRRLEEETARLRRANEQARAELAELERRRVEREAREAESERQRADATARAATEALRREQAARAAAEAQRRAAEERTEAERTARQADAERAAEAERRREALRRENEASRPPAGAYIERRANWSTKGEGYQTFQNATYGECEARCLADARCQSLELYKPERKCNLYANVPLDGASSHADVGIKRVAAAGAASAAPPAAAKARIVRRQNQFFEGDGYHRSAGTSFHACESLCLADAACRAIEVHRRGNICQLYRNVPKSGAANDADIGIKQ